MVEQILRKLGILALAGGISAGCVSAPILGWKDVGRESRLIGNDSEARSEIDYHCTIKSSGKSVDVKVEAEEVNVSDYVETRAPSILQKEVVMNHDELTRQHRRAGWVSLLGGTALGLTRLDRRLYENDRIGIPILLSALASIGYSIYQFEQSSESEETGRSRSVLQDTKEKIVLKSKRIPSGNRIPVSGASVSLDSDYFIFNPSTATTGSSGIAAFQIISEFEFADSLNARSFNSFRKLSSDEFDLVRKMLAERSKSASVVASIDVKGSLKSASKTIDHIVDSGLADSAVSDLIAAKKKKVQEKADALYSSAQRSIEQGDYASAMKNLSELNTVSPRFKDAEELRAKSVKSIEYMRKENEYLRIMFLAEESIAAKNYGKAVDMLTKMLSEKERADAYQLRSIAYDKLGKAREAAADSEKAKSLDPDIATKLK